MTNAKNVIFVNISLIALNIFAQNAKTTTFVSNATKRNE